MNASHFARLVAHAFSDASVDAVVRLMGGVSADVYRLDLRWPDGSARRIVVRIHGASHSGHAADLEYRLLEALHRTGLPVPEPLMADASGQLLPDPFVVLAYVDGDGEIPRAQAAYHIDVMAAVLAGIHATPTGSLPSLPRRNDPLEEVFDYLPSGSEWEPLRAHLGRLSDTEYTGSPCLLHGDFWPENLLWADGALRAVLDWEDAALGDPISDLAVARVELRYRFGREGMDRFTAAYAGRRPVDRSRLALWQVYVAAAAQRFMGQWGLPEHRVAHMRQEALASIREAGAALMEGGR